MGRQRNWLERAPAPCPYVKIKELVMTRLTQSLSSMGALLVFATSASAQCPALDFEDFSDGTIVGSLYPGVTITAQPGTCPGVVPAVIRITSGPTASGTRAVTTGTGCPDFSPDYLRLVFDDLQDSVSFMVGDLGGSPGFTFDIRAYDNDGHRSPVQFAGSGRE